MRLSQRRPGGADWTTTSRHCGDWPRRSRRVVSKRCKPGCSSRFTRRLIIYVLQFPKKNGSFMSRTGVVFFSMQNNYSHPSLCSRSPQMDAGESRRLMMDYNNFYLPHQFSTTSAQVSPCLVPAAFAPQDVFGPGTAAGLGPTLEPCGYAIQSPASAKQPHIFPWMTESRQNKSRTHKSPSKARKEEKSVVVVEGKPCECARSRMGAPPTAQCSTSSPPD